MIKQAYNKENHNLVFKISKVTREDIGNDKGVKLFYVGELIDGSKDPAKVTSNYREPVNGFDVDWSEIPITAPISKLAPKSITENGVYNPKDDGVDGYNSVAVEVSAGLEDYFYTELMSTTGTGGVKSLASVVLKKAPTIDISEDVTNLNYMFNHYQMEFIPRFNCKKGQITSLVSLTANCSFLELTDPTKYITQFFEDIDTSNVLDMESMFGGATGLVYIPEIEAGKCQKIYHVFSPYSTYNKLTYFGGLKDIGKNFSPSRAEDYNYYTYDLGNLPLLTRDSVLSIFNNLYDIASIGVKPQSIKLHANVKALLSEEDTAIATNKGWKVL